MTTTRDAIQEARPASPFPHPVEHPIPTGLWSIIRPVRGRILSAMALAIGSAALELLSLVAIPLLLGEILRHLAPQKELWLLLGVIALTSLLAFALRIWAFHVSHRAAFALEERLRLRLADHLGRVPLGYVTTLGSGALKKVIQDDVRSLHAFVADSTPMIGRACAAPLLTIVLLFLLDWRLTLAVLALLPIGIIAFQLAMRDYAEKRHNYDRSNEQINTAVVEFVQGMQVIRTFDDGTSSFRRYSQALDAFTFHLKSWMEATDIAERVIRVVFASLPALLVAVGVGSWFLLQGSLTFVTLLQFCFLATGVSEAVMPLMWLSHLLTLSKASAMRIGEVLAVAPLPPPLFPQEPRSTVLTFQDVTFFYPGRTSPALEGVSFTASPGTVTALVGPSGGGKSTLAQLTLRFWDVAAGSIQIGGVDLRQMTSETLMRTISFVFQQHFLLDETIRENIRLGRPQATDAEIEAAAQAAQAHDFIMALPQGYDTLVGERGTRLSGGERQRVTIARAILQDCPIVVLDEATAFADPENEVLIQAGLARLTAGKTLLIIAHRLSTIQDADQILVLDQGRLVEQGTQPALLAANGLYTRLWHHHQQAGEWTLRAPQAGQPEGGPSSC
jgi:ATP-binding cassette, subfamily B, bacterial IrtA/YbtP